jgi:hypothetical protein
MKFLLHYSLFYFHFCVCRENVRKINETFFFPNTYNERKYEIFLMKIEAIDLLHDA